MTEDLKSLGEQIEHALAKHMPHQSDIAQPMLDAMRYAVLGGGKRLRPMMVCASCQAFGGQVTQALPVACAFEFIHAYSLIHDDLPAMDDDTLRHGKAATHVAFGEANAILAGDSLHSLAFQAVVDAQDITDGAKLRIIGLLSKAAGWPGMSGGQCLDIEAEGTSLSLAELEALHQAKTGALIRAALESGALCAGTDPSSREFARLGTFGDKIGLAFQVVDDVLDITQDSATLGKPADSDTVNDKNTFPRLMGLEAAKEKAHGLLEESLALLEEASIATPLMIRLAKKSVQRSF